MDAYTASDMDIRAVDPAALVDIRDVKVNTALPKRERILDFIRYEGWMKNKKSAMISCNDGFRPVSFLIEALDEDAENEL